jgi:hypothetical protein
MSPTILWLHRLDHCQPAQAPAKTPDGHATPASAAIVQFRADGKDRERKR